MDIFCQFVSYTQGELHLKNKKTNCIFLSYQNNKGQTLFFLGTISTWMSYSNSQLWLNKIRIKFFPNVNFMCL